MREAGPRKLCHVRGSPQGEPPYEQVREEVKQILAGKKRPISKTTFATPQQIPGAE
jgi:hypothetical protein